MGDAAATPAPVRDAGVTPAPMLREALFGPAVVGEKRTLMVQLCCEARMRRSCRPAG